MAPVWSLAELVHVPGRVVPVIFSSSAAGSAVGSIVFTKIVHNIMIGGHVIKYWPWDVATHHSQCVCLCCAWVMSGDPGNGHILLPAPAFWEGTLVLAYICGQWQLCQFRES
jgi:hypothetical protein